MFGQRCWQTPWERGESEGTGAWWVIMEDEPCVGRGQGPSMVDSQEDLTVRVLCAVTYLSWALCSLSVPVRVERSRQASPRTEIKEMGCLHRISFNSFSIWWKELFTTLFSQSCLTLCDPMDYCSLRPWDSPGKNTGVGCHFLLQGIFQTQGSNPGLLHCRQML